MSTDIKIQDPVNKPVAPSERFTATVMREFETLSGEGLQVTSLQRKLVKNYFIKIDAVLKEAETKRLAKRPEFQGEIAFTWASVNMNKLATDVVAFSAVGLDPLQKNNLFPIPYINNKNKNIDINFTKGYNGIKLVAMKYGFDIPDNIVVELVHENDTFKMIKKDSRNKHDSYVFEVAENAFDRGKVIGGFYFHEYTDKPEKNKLREFSLAQIEKRRPDNASAEFWGGRKPIYKNGVKTNEFEEVEGWFEEMCYKTIDRAAHDAIAIDSEKIDQHFVQMMQIENDAAAIPAPVSDVAAKIEAEANKEEFKFEEAQYADTDLPEKAADVLAKAGQELAEKEDDDEVQPAFGGGLFNQENQ